VTLHPVSRRRAAAVLCLSAVSAIGDGRAAVSPPALDQPEVRARVRAKIMASAGDETVYTDLRPGNWIVLG